MKVVMIVIGALGGLYALVGVVQMVGVLFSASPQTTEGASSLAAGIVPVCLGLIVCVVCFRSAFRKAQSTDESAGDANGADV
jgi:hypothetical protein